jgi:hypothetical protein
MRSILFLTIGLFFVYGCSKKSTMPEIPSLAFSRISAEFLDLSDTSKDLPTIFIEFGYGIRIEKRSTTRDIIKKIELIDKGPKKVNYTNEELPSIAKSINILDAERGTLKLAIDRSIFVNKLAVGDSVKWEAVLTDFADRKSLPVVIRALVRTK